MGEQERLRRIILLLVGVSNLLVFSLVAMLGPFFPRYASERFNAKPAAIGIIFSMYPLAQIVVGPFVSSLCRRFGRVTVLQAGHVLLSIGTWLFAAAPAIPAFMIARALQGSAAACVNIAATALVMEFSPGDTLARNMGIQEVITGLGFFLGPILGGVLFSCLGPVLMFVPLALLPLGLMAVLSVTLRLVHMGGSNGCEEGEGPEVVTKRPIWRNRAVTLVALALMCDAACLGFLDPTLSKHLQVVLGLDVKKTGLVFAVPPLVYSTTSLLISHITARLGNKSTMSLGMLIVSAAFFTLGPVPLPGFIHAYIHPSSPHQEDLFSKPVAWAVNVAALAGIGLGSSLVIVPAVPLMLNAVEDESSGDMKDAVAAVYTLAWSVGDWMGPFLGGLMAQLLPASLEARCDGAWRAEDCRTAFRLSSALYGVMLLCCWICLVSVVPKEHVPPPSMVRWESGDGGCVVVRPTEKTAVAVHTHPQYHSVQQTDGSA